MRSALGAGFRGLEHQENDEKRAISGGGAEMCIRQARIVSLLDTASETRPAQASHSARFGCAWQCGVHRGAAGGEAAEIRLRLG